MGVGILIGDSFSYIVSISLIIVIPLNP